MDRSKFDEIYSISSNAINQNSEDGVRRVNMEKVEWLVRCGLYHYLPSLKEEVDYIINSIDDNGVCRIDVYENEFRGWGPYSGLQLEPDWRAKVRRDCDITFRALLILHYAGL